MSMEEKNFYGNMKREWNVQTVSAYCRATERAEGARGKGFMHAKSAKSVQLINYLCRHGQLINSVGSTCLHAS